MLNSVGWPEIMVLMLVALFVFGPDRLPTITRDAAGALKKIRETMTGAREQISEEFGEDFAGLHLTTLNPKEFIRRQLLEDDPQPLVVRANGSSALRKETISRPSTDEQPPAPPLRAEGETPPYDSDAT